MRLLMFLLTVASFAETKVVLLGTGTPNADPDRSGPAVAVVVDGTPYLVDFGPGVVRRAAAAARAGEAGLKVSKLRIAFATHLHSDHTTGLADLMFAPWVLDRTEPLEVYGPPGIAAMVGHIQEAYKEDIETRLHGGEPANKTGWKAIAHEVLPGVVYKDERVTVTAFAVPHGQWKHAYGYVFQTKDRRVVISGDTAPSEAVVKACAGCDVLVHEVYSAEKLAKRPPDWQRYHGAYHTSARQLAEIATKARPKLLVLYHQLYWGASDEDLLRELRTGYKGQAVAGVDLGVY
ncbi:MAG: MBL fold metallo-hydrolase [Bryobacteraceae bacterium]